jgi:DNA (cytosine-5)-methyltransferase 1
MSALLKNRARGGPCVRGSCQRCREDKTFLRRKLPPKHSLERRGSIRVVDLFAGCGGMTIGVREAVRSANVRIEVPLAIDSDEEVIKLYRANVPGARTFVGDVTDCFDGPLGATATFNERKVRETCGDVDFLLGGPPCQGHSDLNNHTRRSDPKNGLYLVMVRAAQVLRPRVVVIENVAPVLWDKAGVVVRAANELEQSGYSVAGRVLDLRCVGVPQRRRRYVLIASNIPTLDPTIVLAQLSQDLWGHPDRTVHWAIGDLRQVRSKSSFDSASHTSKANIARIDYLFDHGVYDLPNPERPSCHRDREHSYVSMYGRLRWTKPAHTVTTGFGSMGQGRYVHPSRRRTITPHEAARLQTFPDWFDFGTDTPRGVLAKAIGNAVPPLLMVRLGRAIIPALRSVEEIWKRISA